MVSIQETARVPFVLANDANTIGTVKSHSLAQGQSHSGKFDILDWHLHWTKSSLQPVPGYIDRVLGMNHPGAASN